MTQITQADVEALISRYVLEVNEYDDRSSPEDWPEALLITSEELTSLLDRFSEDVLATLSPDTSPGDQWRCVNCKHVVAAHVEPRKCSECRCSTFAHLPPDTSPVTPASDERVKRYRIALEAIDDLCSDEIKARFGNDSSLTEEQCAKGSRIYPLLLVPRNIARAALNEQEANRE